MSSVNENSNDNNVENLLADPCNGLDVARATDAGLLTTTVMATRCARSAYQYHAIPTTAPAADGAPTKQPTSARVTDRKRFALESVVQMEFDHVLPGLIKSLLPSQGLVAVHGKPGVYKSFVALDMGIAVAHGDAEWGGRRVQRAKVVYIAAEGASGMRKRIGGVLRRRGLRSSNVHLRLISTTPNFGTAKNDLEDLLSDIVASGFNPGLVIVDTLAATLGSADENGPGMTQFVACMNEIASRLKCCVLIVHHQPHGEDRLRGHSSLQGAMDGIIAVALGKEPLTAIVSVTKAKDDATGPALKVQLSREVLGFDADGDEISTLVIASVTPTSEIALAGKAAKGRLPQNSVLMMDIIKKLLAKGDQSRKPDQDSAKMRDVNDEVVRQEYYKRIAECAAPGEDETKLSARRRKEFNRAIKILLDRKLIVAEIRNGQRFLSQPSPAPGGTRDTPKGVCPGMSRSPTAKGSGQSGTLSRDVPHVPHVPHASLDLEHVSTPGQSGTKRETVMHSGGTVDIAMGMPAPLSECRTGCDTQPAGVHAGESEWAFDEPASEFGEPAGLETPPPLPGDDLGVMADDADGPYPEADDNGDVWL